MTPQSLSLPLMTACGRRQVGHSTSLGLVYADLILFNSSHDIVIFESHPTTVMSPAMPAFALCDSTSFRAFFDSINVGAATHTRVHAHRTSVHLQYHRVRNIVPEPSSSAHLPY